MNSRPQFSYGNKHPFWCIITLGNTRPQSSRWIILPVMDPETQQTHKTQRRHPQTFFFPNICRLLCIWIWYICSLHEYEWRKNPAPLPWGNQTQTTTNSYTLWNFNVRRNIKQHCQTTKAVIHGNYVYLDIWPSNSSIFQSQMKSWPVKPWILLLQNFWRQLPQKQQTILPARYQHTCFSVLIPKTKHSLKFFWN